LADTGSGETLEALIGNFVNTDSSASIEECAQMLMATLTAKVSKDVLRRYASGVHLSGLTSEGVPQFWQIRNIGSMNGFAYTDFRDFYWMSEELSEVHAKAVYDPISGGYTRQFCAWFANGDLRPHQTAWAAFGDFAAKMDAIGLATKPTSPADLEKRLRWKMEALGKYYDIVAQQPLVGGGTDTHILTPR